MKIWIVIAILAVVLLVVLFWNNKSTTPLSTSPASGATGDPLQDAVANMLGETTGGLNSRTCRRDCDSLCGSLSDKLFGCGDRCNCKRDCESACIKGLNYKSMFP